MTTLARNWPKIALGLGFVSNLSYAWVSSKKRRRLEYPGGSEGILPGRLLKFSEFYRVEGSHRKARKKEKDRDIFVSYLSPVHSYLLLNFTVTPPLSPILIVLQLCKFMLRHSNIARFLAKFFKFLKVKWPTGCLVLAAHLEGVGNKLSRCYGRLINSKTAYILRRTQTSLSRWKCASKRKVGRSKRARLSSFSLSWFISLRHQSLLFRAPLYSKYRVPEELVGLYWSYHKGKCIDFYCNVT